jgi:hypothetical protein
MAMKDTTDDERNLTDELGRLRRIHARATGPLPPAALDKDILARSREAVRAPARSRRWWIPASVAATALIAFSLVTRIQHEAANGLPETRVVAAPQPAATAARDTAEAVSPVAIGPLPTTVPAAAGAEPAPAPAADRPAEKRTVPPREAMPRMASGPATALAGDQAAAAPVAAQPAAQEQPAMVLNEDKVVAPPAPKAGRMAPRLTPEAWLARIEALEAAGQMEDAARERALLEQAYPGWLAGREGPH